MNTMLVDWRNPAGWTYEQKQRKADLVSVYWTASAESVKDISGKKLVAWQPGLPLYATGEVVRTPYSLELEKIANQYKARTGDLFIEDPVGMSVERLDLTKRGFAAAWAGLMVRQFPWADGFHLDYWWSGIVPEVEQPAWEKGMSTFAAILRMQDPDAILIGQNDRLLGDTWSSLNGCFLEQSPYFNGRNPAVHALDLNAFKGLMARAHPERPMISVMEVREPWRWALTDLDNVLRWADGLGLYCSLGRDKTGGWTP